MSGSLAGKICLVTGGSRGLGRGIALQLGEAGATVYVTGRSFKTGDLGKTVDKTAEEIEERGGKCIPVKCDHSNEAEVKELFERIKTEQNGQLDILVNNAYSAVRGILENMGKPFWEVDPSFWDEVNNVGLRNHYFCTVYASRLMVERKQGLIVNVSSAGGLRYLFNVPYGIGKEACDRMAADCGHELRKHKVAMVSLWPGAVLTEIISDTMTSMNDKSKSMFADAESTEYAGKAIVHLAKDPNLMSKSGKILMTADLGAEYGFVDIDGRSIASMRSAKSMVSFMGSPGLASWIPSWLKIPRTLFYLGGCKL